MLITRFPVTYDKSLLLFLQETYVNSSEEGISATIRIVYECAVCERDVQLKLLLLVSAKLGGPIEEASRLEGFCIEGLLLQPVDTTSEDFGLMKCCSF